MSELNQNPQNIDENLRRQVLMPAHVPETTLSYGQQREVVTDAVGQGIDYAFAQHAESIVVDEAGRRSLSLNIPDNRGRVTARITESSEPDGTRTYDLSLESKKVRSNYWRFSDGPNGKSLLPCSVDPETGELVPAKAGEYYNPHKDDEVVQWGKPWVSNLYEGKPKRPASGTFRKLLGRKAVAN